jgi:biopolymer transport protein ExbB
LPEVSELENIYMTMLSEMKQQAQVVTFTGELADETLEITRAGTFLAWTAKGAEFIKMEDGDMVKLSRQPAGRIRGLAKNVSNGDPSKIVKGPIDPTRGSLLAMVVRTPSLMERYHAGGYIGYAVSVMAGIGIFVGLWRLFALFMTGSAVRAQSRKSTPGNNPLGRIMSAYESSKDKDLETVELKLDDAIIKETGKLEFGISLIKVLAAVSPLMGLLGTVIGMIQTFQAITLFGAGDPQLMADGISFALVTTVLGLLSAIPLLLLHSFTSSAARTVQQVLEEQASGMIAANAEARSK